MTAPFLFIIKKKKKITTEFSAEKTYIEDDNGRSSDQSCIDTNRR
jgi:hypothetical protein